MSTDSNPDAQGAAGNPAPPHDPNEGFRKLLEKHKDDAVRLAETLYGENFKLRERLRKAEDRVPGDSDVVLKGDDAKRWDAYRGLGEPGDLRKSLKQAEADAADVGRFRRAETYREAAQVAGYRAEAFARLAEQDRLDLEIKEEKAAGGKLARRVLVKGEGDEVTPLDEYVDSRWQAFAESLGGPEAGPPKKPVGTPPRRSLTPPPPPHGDVEDPIDRETRMLGHYQSF